VLRERDVLMDCPCGRHDAAGRAFSYDQCCGLWLDHWEQPAPDAQALMRSRYSAFVLAQEDYLLHTWHVSKRPSQVSFHPGTKWLGLDVREHRVIDATHAEVEFVARQREASGRAVRLHERSRFLRELDEAGVLRWYYVDGDWK
jgi:SEC-C motif-containing protein